MALNRLRNGAKTFQFANAVGVPMFNGRFESISRTLRILRVTIDPFANAYAQYKDKHRICQANTQINDALKKARPARKKAFAKQQAPFEEEVVTVTGEVAPENIVDDMLATETSWRALEKGNEGDLQYVKQWRVSEEPQFVTDSTPRCNTEG